MKSLEERKQLPKVVAVKPVDNYLLILQFKSGETKVYDLKPLLEHPFFKPLQNVELFNQAHLVYESTVGWNDDLDISPETLYEDSIPFNSSFK
jgi:hypothetical protein